MRGSDPAPGLRPPTVDPAPDRLICPASDIFDAAAVRAAIDAGPGPGADPLAIRGHCVKVLTAARDRGTAAIEAAFAAAAASMRARRCAPMPT